MKWLALLLGVSVVAGIVALVVAIGSTRDTVPGTLRDCVLDGNAGLVRGPADLGGQIRSDIDAGTIRERSRARVGDDTAVLLAGTNYRILVLAGRASPPLDGDLGRRVYERAGEYALVAKEVDPVQGALGGCIALATGG